MCHLSFFVLWHEMLQLGVTACLPVVFVCLVVFWGGRGVGVLHLEQDQFSAKLKQGVLPLLPDLRVV